MPGFDENEYQKRALFPVVSAASPPQGRKHDLLDAVRAAVVLHFYLAGDTPDAAKWAAISSGRSGRS